MISAHFGRCRLLLITLAVAAGWGVTVPGARAQDGSIVVAVAGAGYEGFSGDGGPAVAADLDYPESVALDAANNLYIADSENNRIRKVSPDGTISTLAGTGVAGGSGDGGPALQAQLSQPEGVAADAKGNLFIADYGNHSVRKIGPDGLITTVAGGKIGPSADGGPALGAALQGVVSVAVDAQGDLFIADAEDFRVRKVSPDGIITTVAGNGVEGYSGDGSFAAVASLDRPTDVAVDSAGDLYIADSWNNRIRKVTPDRIITTVAGSGDPAAMTGGFGGDGGPATEATLNTPTDIAVDSAGDLFIADTFNSRVRQVDPNGVITTVVGNGTEGAGDGAGRGIGSMVTLNAPNAVEVDSAGNLFIADNGNHRVIEALAIAHPGLLAGQPYPAFALGDVNGDGKINVRDAILVLQYSVRLAELTPLQAVAADVNRDGRINVLDAVLILRRSVGLP